MEQRDFDCPYEIASERTKRGVTPADEPRERAWSGQRGKKTLLSFTLVCRANAWRQRSEVVGVRGHFGACVSAMAVCAGRTCYVCIRTAVAENVKWGVWLGRHSY